MAHSRAVASTISQPRSASSRRSRFSSGSRLADFICSKAARRKPPVPAAGSHTREAVRNELVTRQDQPHAAIAAHLGVPQWVPDQECQALAQSSRSACPHPGTKRISADCLVGDLDAVLLSPGDYLPITPVAVPDLPFARELAHLRNPECLPDLISK